jgi:hypothetical protein
MGPGTLLLDNEERSLLLSTQMVLMRWDTNTRIQYSGFTVQDSWVQDLGTNMGRLVDVKHSLSLVDEQWQAHLVIHAGVCTASVPPVFVCMKGSALDSLINLDRCLPKTLMQWVDTCRGLTLTQKPHTHVFPSHMVVIVYMQRSGKPSGTACAYPAIHPHMHSRAACPFRQPRAGAGCDGTEPHQREP